MIRKGVCCIAFKDDNILNVTFLDCVTEDIFFQMMETLMLFYEKDEYIYCRN